VVPGGRLLLALLLLTLPLVPADQHPDGLSFTATLDAIKIDGRPGQVVTRQFKLTLDPNQPRTHFKMHVEDWWRSEDGKQSFYAEPGTLKRSCANWVSLNPREAEVAGGTTMTVRVSVAIPADRRAGGYWCALTADEVPDPLADSSRVAVRFVASVSTGIFVTLDPVERAASIVDLQVQAGDAIVKVRNDGNAPLSIDGHIEFRRPGAQAPSATIDVARVTILTEPITDSILRVALPSSHVLPSGRYNVRAILDFGADHYIGAERDLELTRAAAGDVPIR
jgi:hypothetical protein